MMNFVLKYCSFPVGPCGRLKVPILNPVYDLHVLPVDFVMVFFLWTKNMHVWIKSDAKLHIGVSLILSVIDRRHLPAALLGTPV